MDVVFSYQRQRTPGFSNGGLLQNLESITAEDSHTLLIKVNPGFPDADFLVSLADGHSKVVAEEAVKESKGDLRGGPVVGSGPWIWKSTSRDLGSEFTRNPDYFEDGLPFLDELAVSVIRDDRSRYAAFVTGQVDAYRITAEFWDELIASGRPFDQFQARQGGTGLLLAMNVSRPPFDSAEVRRAVLKAIDPWNYIDTVWAGRDTSAWGCPSCGPTGC